MTREENEQEQQHLQQHLQQEGQEKAEQIRPRNNNNNINNNNNKTGKRFRGAGAALRSSSCVGLSYIEFLPCSNARAPEYCILAFGPIFPALVPPVAVRKSVDPHYGAPRGLPLPLLDRQTRASLCGHIHSTAPDSVLPMRRLRFAFAN